MNQSHHKKRKNQKSQNPSPVESQAHKEWVAKRREFMERHTGGREPEGAVLAIMNASIGDEPPFE